MTFSLLLCLAALAGNSFTETADFIGESDMSDKIDVGAGDHVLFADLCGDGIYDVIITADQTWVEVDSTHAGLERQVGQAYVFFGAPNLSGSYDLANADLILHGEDAGDHFGSSIANAGDIDGDGMDDLLIGADVADTQDCMDDPACASEYTGAAYVLYGKNLCNVRDVGLSYDLKFTSSRPKEGLGNSVAGGFDFDADGYSDIVIGSNEANLIGAPTALNWGAIYVIKNVRNMAGVVNVDDFGTNDDMAKFLGEAEYQQFGHAVINAGDLDGDGYGDFAASAFNTADFEQGAVYSLYEITAAHWTHSIEHDMYTEADLVIDGVSDNNLGRSLSSAGDFDGDGYDDLIIGGPRADEGYTDSGSAYIFYGPLSGSYDSDGADVTVNGYDTQDFVGSFVLGGGDVDGDGYDDVLIGGSRIDDFAVRAGRVCLLPGGQTLYSSVAYSLSGPLNFTPIHLVCVDGDAYVDQLGGNGAYESIEGTMADINGDGYSDWGLGVPGLENSLGASVGGAKVFMGEEAMPHSVGGGIVFP